MARKRTVASWKRLQANQALRDLVELTRLDITNAYRLLDVGKESYPREAAALTGADIGIERLEHKLDALATPEEEPKEGHEPEESENAGE